MSRYAPYLATVLVILHLSLILPRGGLLHDWFFPYTTQKWQIALIVSLCIVSRLSGRLNTNRGRDSLLIFWLVAYAAIALFSTFHSPHDNLTLMMALLTGLNPIALAYCLPKVINRGQYQAIFLWASGLLVAHALIEVYLIATQASTFVGRDILWDHGRLRTWDFLKPYTGGLYTNPNTTGAYLMLIPGVVMFLYLEAKQKWYKTLLLVALALIFFSVLLTFSRSALLVGISSVALWGLLKLKQKGVPAWAGATAIAASGAALFVALFSATTLPNLLYLSGREQLWHHVSTAFSRATLLGIGIFGQYDRGLTPHDFWLANLTYFGIAGFIALAGWMLCFSRRILRTLWLYREEKLWPLAGTLFAFVGVYGLFEYIFTYPVFFTSSLSYIIIGYLAHYTGSHDAQKPVITKRREAPERVPAISR